MSQELERESKAEWHSLRVDIRRLRQPHVASSTLGHASTSWPYLDVPSARALVWVGWPRPWHSVADKPVVPQRVLADVDLFLTLLQAPRIILLAETWGQGRWSESEGR